MTNNPSQKSSNLCLLFPPQVSSFNISHFLQLATSEDLWIGLPLIETSAESTFMTHCEDLNLNVNSSEISTIDLMQCKVMRSRKLIKPLLFALNYFSQQSTMWAESFAKLIQSVCPRVAKSLLYLDIVYRIPTFNFGLETWRHEIINNIPWIRSNFWVR